MDPKNIFIWNVRGLNSTSRQSSVCSFIESFEADIVCLQETKMQNLSNRVVMSYLGADFEDFLDLPSVGASGGILLAWKRHIQATGLRRVDHWIPTVFLCNFRKFYGQSWWLTCVHGPPK